MYVYVVAWIHVNMHILFCEHMRGTTMLDVIERFSWHCGQVVISIVPLSPSRIIIICDKKWHVWILFCELYEHCIQRAASSELNMMFIQWANEIHTHHFFIYYFYCWFIRDFNWNYFVMCINTIRRVWVGLLVPWLEHSDWLRLRLMDQSQEILPGHAIFASSKYGYYDYRRIAHSISNKI